MLASELDLTRDRILRNCAITMFLGSIFYFVTLMRGGVYGILDIIGSVFAVLTSVLGIAAKNRYNLDLAIKYKICLSVLLALQTINLTGIIVNFLLHGSDLELFIAKIIGHLISISFQIWSLIVARNYTQILGGDYISQDLNDSFLGEEEKFNG